MKKLSIFLLCWTMCLTGFTQGENNIWTFGDNYSLDFNNNPPLLKDTTYVNGTSNEDQTVMYPTEHRYNFAQAVCDANGKRLFFVKRYTYRSGHAAPCIFDKDEIPIAGTEFLSTDDMENTRPVIIPYPGNPDRYYIFYVRNGGLIYCLFDLSLNNGRGDIVPGYKNVLCYSYNTLVGSRMVAVQGCDGIWLVTRHRIYNQFLSFKISEVGLSMQPVISEIGSFSTMNYWGSNGVLAASPDGKKLAMGLPQGGVFNFKGGIEMYDFEKCSGKLKNAQIIDTGFWVHGICFSPDNSKLYGGYALPAPSFAGRYDQYVYQFDLNQPTLPAITNSKTLILTNPYAYSEGPFCPITTNIMGNMMCGPNGKIYLSNSHPGVCAGTGPGMALHVINYPNNNGLNSNPQTNAIWNQVNGMGSLGYADMPYQVVVPPKKNIDTISGNSDHFTICFKSDTLLKTPSDLNCYWWEDGSTDTLRSISQNGEFRLYYFKDCSIYVDTYTLRFLPLPNVDLQQFGCPGNISLEAGTINGSRYEYILRNDQHQIVHAHITDSVFVTTGLSQGTYYLEIISADGCLKELNVELVAYPKPEVIIVPEFSEINFGQQITLKATGANFYTWSPSASLDNSYLDEVIAKPQANTRYRVVGINDYGCQDTAIAQVTIKNDDRMILPNAFTPNADGNNDVFKVPGNHFKIRLFEVYNRYGQLVYADSGSNTGWDGTHNGKYNDQGVYYYIIQLDLPDGTNKVFRGEVTLLR